MLIVLTLFSLALTSICVFMQAGMQLLRRSDRRVETQRSALRLTGRLMTEAQSCPVSAFTLADTGVGNLSLAFVHPTGPDGQRELEAGTGVALFRLRLVYYRQPDGRLRRHALPLNPAQAAPSALPPADLLSAVAAGPGDVLLSGVDRFFEVSPRRLRLELTTAASEKVELECNLP